MPPPVLIFSLDHFAMAFWPCCCAMESKWLPQPRAGSLSDDVHNGPWWLGLANSGVRNYIRIDSREWQLRAEGSRKQLFDWLAYADLLWTLETCLLSFYRRLDSGVNSMPPDINLEFALITVTLLGTLFMIISRRWSISKHWQVPDPRNICQPVVSRFQAWTLICTSILTDFCITTI
ncbi:hypothetical protein GMORB2_1971 [Geosmithia morbida]|uniref:Uncharacterized protein n=1 Tax=Geosmithia morbida TaxID=1094350 RepID=A0A9P5CZH2_9HYPO|nr:uncharacterized protein GMORB2_1971 [Geosmithia morbida]KAF4121563.1 hypothetical protein GMORB2_1971 [Geosmithia morbida]